MMVRVVLRSGRTARPRRRGAVRGVTGTFSTSPDICSGAGLSEPARLVLDMATTMAVNHILLSTALERG
jgi:hypothetical protein